MLHGNGQSRRNDLQDGRRKLRDCQRASIAGNPTEASRASPKILSQPGNSSRLTLNFNLGFGFDFQKAFFVPLLAHFFTSTEGRGVGCGSLWLIDFPRLLCTVDFGVVTQLCRLEKNAFDVGEA